MILFLSILILVLTAAGQLLLKMGAVKRQGNWLFNRYVLAGYVLFCIAVLASYYLMHIIEMKYFTVIMSLSYVTVTLASRIFLREKIDRRRAIGTALVVAGVSIFVIN